MAQKRDIRELDAWLISLLENHWIVFNVLAIALVVSLSGLVLLLEWIFQRSFAG